jgi:phosphoribosylanthranilate isomerase
VAGDKPPRYICEMERGPRTRVKICCMADADEVRLAVAEGADALGFVSAMPSGPGPIPEDLIAALQATVPPGIGTFLLTSLLDADAIAQQQRRCRTNTLQLVDRIDDTGHARLRRELPGIALVQVLHVAGPDAIDEALALAPVVDGFLLDSGNPTATVKELGGTGRVHDWHISRALREQVQRPVFLAGGLTPDNVADAIRLVGPYAVDVCSGVRTEGRLDATKLRHFMQAVQAASAGVRTADSRRRRRLT